MREIDERVVLAEENHEAWTRMRSQASGHRLHIERFAQWTTTTRPAGVILVSRCRFSDDPEEFEFELGQVLRSYQEADCPANWSWGPLGTPQDLGKRLRKRHMMGPRYIPAMTLDLRTARIEKPKWPTEIVSDWTEFEVVQYPLANWMPKNYKGDSEHMLAEVQALSPDQVFPIVARIDGRAAACVTLFLDQGVAGIYDVVTLPQYRLRGAATSALNYAFALALERGAHSASLNAYPKAASLYEKLGFEEVGKITGMYYSRTRMQADRDA